jgi:hypothetical protein
MKNVHLFFWTLNTLLAGQSFTLGNTGWGIAHAVASLFSLLAYTSAVEREALERR